jgi:alpha-beta hydrolase superfamily lysophospholipase/SAM-dependent methyltransferase
VPKKALDSLEHDRSSVGPPTEHTLCLEDGTRIFYRAWLPEGPTRHVLLMFHRGHEHSGRLADVVEALGLDDVAVFAWDSRGHGRSDGVRGYAPSFTCIVKDVDTFARHVCAEHGFRMEDMVVLAHSVGAVSVTTWVHDFAPPIRALVLVTPAFRVKLYVPFAIPGLRLLRRLKGDEKVFLQSYVKSRMLTHDQEQARRYDEDPLIARAIAVNILLDMFDTARRVVRDAGAIRVPTLLLSGGSDWVVDVGIQRRFFESLGAPVKRMKVFPGMYHDLLHEADRHLVLDEVRGFVVDAFTQPRAREALVDADERGYTKEEHDRLAAPLEVLSPKGFYYGLQSLGLRTLGRLSRGIRVGLDTGFDSGLSLDYVYENQAQGSLIIGRLIDRLYLDSIGWRGIRQRKSLLQGILERAIRSVAAEGSAVHLLDVACGGGRYVLEVLRSLEDVEIDALLRDFTPANLEAGRTQAESMGIQGVRFEQGDAFDEEAVAAVRPSPNVAIVSGLHELIPENHLVMNSLRGLARALRAGAEASGGTAYLVYTGQPWHPQLETIARVLNNRDGVRWVMRRRTQEEMDDLVQAAGFRKVTMEIDDFGIFTVSLASIEAP